MSPVGRGLEARERRGLRPGRARQLRRSSTPAATPASGPDQPASEGTGDKDPLREQTIYIPYEKLKNVFEKPGRGVFVPYEKFQELWNAARARTRAEQPADGRSMR